MAKRNKSATRRRSLLERCFDPDAAVRARVIKQLVKTYREPAKRRVHQFLTIVAMAHGSPRSSSSAQIFSSIIEREGILSSIEKLSKPPPTYAWLKPSKRIRGCCFSIDVE